jgi:3-oxoacyl-[acyl-carrier-protein] synthase-1
MQMAMATATRKVDYINTHGTSTPVGDIKELEAVRAAFVGATIPPISSTKSLTGHSLGAAGVQEAIYSLLMLEHNFIAASAHIDNLDPALGDAPIVREMINTKLNAVMSNSFGFGGTNAALVFERYEG